MSRGVPPAECSTSSFCESELTYCRPSQRPAFEGTRIGRSFGRHQRQSSKNCLLTTVNKRCCTCSATVNNGAGWQRSPPAESSHSLCSVFDGTARTVCTDFVAETQLPTSSGQFRLRAYRHTVHLVGCFFKRSDEQLKERMLVNSSILCLQ